MKIVKIDNIVINVEELCCFEVSDYTSQKSYLPQQRIDFYFKNGNTVSTKYKSESAINNIVKRIYNIMIL